MKRSNGVIPAEVGSGNLAIKAKFDAVLWFEKARREEIGALAVCGWKGGGDDASFVEYFVPRDEEVRIVLDYARRTRTDVTFIIDAHAAMVWCTQYRPELIAVCMANSRSGGNSGLEQTAPMRPPRATIMRSRSR